ncbi:MAG: PAS domain-containing protein [bacterium]|nr:PAS domain-containing protein [bacterium]
MKRNDMEKLKETDRYDPVLDSIADGVFTVDEKWNITTFNNAAERITGISRDEAIGSQCSDVFRASICECGCALRETMNTGQSSINKPVEIMSAAGIRIPISISTAILRDKNDNIIGGVETFRDLTTEEVLRKKLEGKYSFYDIITRNHKMQEILSLIPTISESEATCLITGESGTGKELVARAIHNQSYRKSEPFVALNCAALPDTLLESELFGYEKGAFTDAIKDKPGKIALAEGGTIFLDEIGDISPALQVKLLRFLQEKEYDPLGSTQTKKANVRIISATNKSIDKLVKKEVFRADLYFRINVVEINLPPLRERRNDLMLLADYFIDRLNRIRKKDIAGLSREVIIKFMEYDWPGNIRELENALETAFVLCHNGMIQVHHLPGHFRDKDTQEKESGNMDLKNIEVQVIIEALKKNNYKKLATANDLGINKTTLWRKIKKYNIQLPH